MTCRAQPKAYGEGHTVWTAPVPMSLRGVQHLPGWPKAQCFSSLSPHEKSICRAQMRPRPAYVSLFPCLLRSLRAAAITQR